MIEKSRRKELLRGFRDRKQIVGIYAVRCAPAGRIWIAASKNLDRQRNGIWFQLRLGGHSNKAMEGAWKAHGESSFQYEILEEVVDDNPLLLDLLLKERAAYWRKALEAEPVVG